MAKTSLTKKIITLIALMLCVVMAFSACNQTGGENPEKEGETQNTLQNEDEGTEEGDKETESKDKETESKDKDTESKDKDTESKDKNDKPSGGNKPSSNEKSTVWGSNDVDEILSSMPDKVKDKEIHVLMWREYTESEQKQVDDFQKKTGVKVRTTITTEYEYSTKLIALISDKDAPDVVNLGCREFPSRPTKAMQLLDEETFRLDDECWQKSYMEPYSVKGKYYSVAMPGTWSVEDTTFITIYNKAILKDAGVSTMPYQLYKSGKWNWAEQQKIMEKVKAAGKVPMTTQGADLYMLSAGVDFASYNPTKGEFVSLLDDTKVRPTIENSWKALQEATNKELITTKFDISGFRQGKYGFMSIICFTFYNQGGHLDGVDGGIQNIEAVPVAGPTQSSAYIPFRPKAWGVAKGADNVEGAAYFIRYFLDPKTIDMDSTFWHKQFKEVFNIITDKNARKMVQVGYGITDYSNGRGTYDAIVNELATATVGQAPTIINKHKGKINISIKRANAAIERVAKKIK